MAYNAPENPIHKEWSITTVTTLLRHPLFRPSLALLLSGLTSSPAIGLCLGALMGLSMGNEAGAATAKRGKQWLQLSVILLGFGLPMGLILQVGTASVGLTFLSILATLTVGLLLGRVFSVERDLSLLLSGGTAICGGSAIAALAPAIGASSAHTAVALAVVFLLNSLGLLLFPFLGQLAQLSQEQFGLWAALAIHDTSSVVGAGAAYGPEALALATTIKLTRALWILPVSFAAARLYGSRSRAKVPWFLFGFLLAALVSTLLPGPAALWKGLALAGKRLMVGTLFLVGATLTREDLKQAGGRPLLEALVLWVLVSGLSLALIKFGGLRLALPS